MMYTARYNSPLGTMLLACDDEGLCGAWFEGQKYYAQGLCNAETREHKHLCAAADWLDEYFAGTVPPRFEKLHLTATPFRALVWDELRNIPYGETRTYGELARTVAVKMNKPKMSARAIGCAIGHNPVSIIIPCHRVIGGTGALTGYAGGVERKRELLQWERAKA